jgi:hypothetical protein
VHQSHHSLTFGRPNISRSDPPLPTVFAPHPAQPLLALFDPPIKPASSRPRGHLHLDRWVDFSAISFGMLPHIIVAEIHI